MKRPFHRRRLATLFFAMLVAFVCVSPSGPDAPFESAVIELECETADAADEETSTATFRATPPPKRAVALNVYATIWFVPPRAGATASPRSPPPAHLLS